MNELKFHRPGGGKHLKADDEWRERQTNNPLYSAGISIPEQDLHGRASIALQKTDKKTCPISCVVRAAPISARRNQLFSSSIFQIQQGRKSANNTLRIPFEHCRYSRHFTKKDPGVFLFVLQPLNLERSSLRHEIRKGEDCLLRQTPEVSPGFFSSLSERKFSDSVSATSTFVGVTAKSSNK